MIPAWEEAVRRGCLDDLRALLATGADIDARDRRNQTALMLAVVAGHGHVIAWLIEEGADLDHTAKYGLSALMLAVVRGHADFVQMLARAGANLSLRGSGAPGFAEMTALDLAVARGDAVMIATLRSGAEGQPA